MRLCCPLEGTSDKHTKHGHLAGVGAQCKPRQIANPRIPALTVNIQKRLRNDTTLRRRITCLGFDLRPVRMIWGYHQTRLYQIKRKSSWLGFLQVGRPTAHYRPQCKTVRGICCLQPPVKKGFGERNKGLTTKSDFFSLPFMRNLEISDSWLAIRRVQTSPESHMTWLQARETSPVDSKQTPYLGGKERSVDRHSSQASSARTLKLICSPAQARTDGWPYLEASG